jgi:hypothetical protein
MGESQGKNMVFKCLDDFDTSPSISYADPDLEGENSAT